MLSRLKLFTSIAKQNLETVRSKTKARYDVKTKVPNLKLHDKVLLRNPVVKPGQSLKFIYKYSGPYIIVKLGPNFTY